MMSSCFGLWLLVFGPLLSGLPSSVNSLSFSPVAGISLFMLNQFSSPIKNFPITHTHRAHISVLPALTSLPTAFPARENQWDSLVQQHCACSFPLSVFHFPLPQLPADSRVSSPSTVNERANCKNVLMRLLTAADNGEQF